MAERAAIEWLSCACANSFGREWFRASLQEAIDVVNRACLNYGWADRESAAKQHRPIILLARPELVDVMREIREGQT